MALRQLQFSLHSIPKGVRNVLGLPQRQGDVLVASGLSIWGEMGGGERSERGDGVCVCAHAMHDGSRVPTDPRIPTLPGRGTLSSQRPGRHCLHQSQSTVRCWASRIKDELYPAKNHSSGGLPCVYISASNRSLCFLVWPRLKRAMSIYVPRS